MKLQAAELMARNLMAEHGLQGWTFGFDVSIRRFGYCAYGPRRISLSSMLTHLNPEQVVRKTVIHEIAHAICWKRWGRGADGHGPRWREIARSLGHSGARCYGDDVIKPPKPFGAVCPRCTFGFTDTWRSRRYCWKCSTEELGPARFLWGRNEAYLRLHEEVFGAPLKAAACGPKER